MKITDEKTGNSIEILTDEHFNSTFIHPLTGEECATMTQALSGFTEQSPESNAGWDRIHQAFQNNTGNVWDFIDDDEDFTIKEEEAE